MTKADIPDTKLTSAAPSPALSKFIESLGRYFESFGIPRIGGRMLGLLMVSEKPLSSEALAATLKVSRASISTNLRMLLQVGWAEKTSFPGDRTTYYIFPENGFEKTLAIELQAISTLKQFIGQGLSALPEESSTRSRMEGVAKWIDFLIGFWQKAQNEWREHQQEPPTFI